MYEGNMGVVAQQSDSLTKQRRLDITLRQNIDEQIALATKHVESLTAAKDRMEKCGLLDMRIDDIQAAMRW